MVVDGQDVTVVLAGLDVQPPINRPLSIEGSAVGPGTIVFEQSLAQALRISIGTPLTLVTAAGSIDLDAVGTAVVPSQAPPILPSSF